MKGLPLSPVDVFTSFFTNSEVSILDSEPSFLKNQEFNLDSQDVQPLDATFESNTSTVLDSEKILESLTKDNNTFEIAIHELIEKNWSLSNLQMYLAQHPYLPSLDVKINSMNARKQTSPLSDAELTIVKALLLKQIKQAPIDQDQINSEQKDSNPT